MLVPVASWVVGTRLPKSKRGTMKIPPPIPSKEPRSPTPTPARINKK
jgi:hypothetical protein